MKLTDEKIKEVLLATDYVLPEDVAKAEAYAKRHYTTIAEYLLNEEILTKDLLGQAIAEHAGLPYADLNSRPPTPELVAAIPEPVARQYRVVAFAEDDRQMIVTTDAPEEAGLLKEVRLAVKKKLGGGKEKKIILAYSLPEDIEGAFVLYHQNITERLGKLFAPATAASTPEMIDQIMLEAAELRASDVHFEPHDQEVVLRFRIDGLLQEVGRLSKEQYERVVNRVKVQAHLRTDEHYAAQDGVIRHRLDGAAIDVRVSIVPTLDGEKIVMRVLAAYVKALTLTDLGLSPAAQSKVFAAAQKPFGMILAVGPTGSGKTTTMYSIMKLLNRPEVNIATIEDPVEYKMMGVNHIQVNLQTNLTFAKGLRSIVRQDPDIILVGEIRDEETAEIAVNAALTGHLLLSTFHANDAATAIPRLLDMGVEPFLLSSTLEIIVAQRLVRRICENCRYSHTVHVGNDTELPADMAEWFPEKIVNLYQGKGCTVCNGTGYKGRIAIFEIIRMTTELQELLLTNPTTREIAALARIQGSGSLFEDGLLKVRAGITTLEEVMRVAAPPPHERLLKSPRSAAHHGAAA